MLSRRKQRAEKSPAPSHPTFFRIRWLIAALLLLAFAPSLITITKQHTAILKLVSPEAGKAISYRSMTTHWWAPIVIDQLTVSDLSVSVSDAAETTELATVERIITTQPLWQVVLSGGRKTELRVEKPVIHLVVQDGSTNIEQTLTEIAGTSTGNSRPFPIVVEVSDGTLHLSSRTSTGNTTAATPITGINGRLSTRNPGTLPELSLTARAVTGNDAAFETQMATQHNNRNPRVAATLSELTSDIASIPFNEQQLRSLQDESSGPLLTVNLSTMENDHDAHEVLFEGRRLNLETFSALMQRLVPGLSCAGTLSCRIQGRLLAGDQHQGLAGRIQLLGEEVQFRQSAWEAGEFIDLDTVTAQGAIAFAEDGVLVKDVRVQCPVLKMNGDGRVESSAGSADDESRVDLNGKIDVAALSNMLPRTLQLGHDVTIRSADVGFSCRIEKDSRSDSDDTVSTIISSQFGDRFLWRLASESSSVSAVKGGRSVELDSPFRVHAVGSADMRGFTLHQARLTGSGGTVTVEPEADGYAINGSIAPEHLWNDLQQIVDLPRPGLAGPVDVKALLNVRPDEYRISTLNINSGDLTATSRQLSFFPKRSLLQAVEGELELQGTASAVRTLIAPWHTATWLSPNAQVAARLQANPSSSIDLQAVVRPANVSRGKTNPQAIASIDQGRLNATIAADSDGRSFLVDRCEIQLPGLQASTTGTLNVIADTLTTNLTSQVEYDLQTLSELLPAEYRNNIRLSGAGRETFQINGVPSLWTAAEIHERGSSSRSTDGGQEPLTPLAVSGRVSWTGGELYQLPLGPGAVKAQLKDGVLRTEPIHCEVGSGRVNFMPQWNLNTNAIQLASGSRIEELQLTSAFCKEWLGYVAPLLSDSTRMNGTVSCRSQQFDYYVDRPEQSSIVGELAIHDGTVSPGQSMLPLLQVLELVTKKPLSSREIQFPPQDVHFEMREGMVYHDNLNFDVAGYGVTSNGGAALDRRIRMELAVSLEKNAGPSESQRLRVPVGGTIDRPQIDTRALLQNFGQNQIENRLNKEIDRGLNRLLDKLR